MRVWNFLQRLCEVLGTGIWDSRYLAWDTDDGLRVHWNVQVVVRVYG